jgi:hypothetical protein
MNAFKFKICLFFVSVLIAASVSAQTTQSGYVKTKGRLDNNGELIPGKRLGNVSIILSNGNSTVSDANGNFSLTIPNKKFYLKNVQKNGYNLLDPDMLKKEYYYSASPFIITMEAPSQLEKDQIETQLRIEKTLRNSIHLREKELDSLREAHKLTEEEYYTQLQQLYDNQANEKLIKEMSKKYAEIDYDLIDSFQKQLSFYILNGELKKADSMLNSRGSIFDDFAALDSLRKANHTVEVTLDSLQEDLDASLSYEHWQRNQLAQLCTDKASTFIKLQQLDSTAHYLAKRAELDTTNVDWQLEAGRFLFEHMNNPDEALPYYQRALVVLKSRNGSEDPQVEFLFKEIDRILSRQRNRK